MTERHNQVNLQRNVRFSVPTTCICQLSLPLLVLSRVRAFLSQIEASNALLEQQANADPKSVDIENITTGQGRYIEMVSNVS